MKNKISLFIYITCCISLLYSAFGYYPKWNKPQSEATISWDVSGYYFYLPAIFIYKDLKHVGFKKAIMDKYHPIAGEAEGYQSFGVENGNQIMKYSMGQALMYLPGFFVGHVTAGLLGYEQDGFSLPYQMAISLQSVLFACLGLWVLRKLLLHYFSDWASALSLLSIVLATNYLCYASINAPMTHNYVFTLYTFLIAFSLRFYKKPSYTSAIAIGIIIGIAALTRPTEIVSVLIPLLIGVSSWAMLRERFEFIKSHFFKYLIAAIACVAIGSLQLIYWKTIGGHWLIYSYVEEKFSWGSPHLYYWSLSYRAGWLVYTPFMIFALLGFYQLWHRSRSIFWAFTIYSVLFIYIASAWDIWWYGGSLGQRSVVQLYAVLAFPLAAFWDSVLLKKIAPWIMGAILTFCIYYNVWMTHQAHVAGTWVCGDMTKAYFWKIFLKNKSDISPDAVKFLDTNDDYTGERADMKVLYTNDFEVDTSSMMTKEQPITGKQSLLINATHTQSPFYTIPFKSGDAKWLRTSIKCFNVQKEYDMWHMANLGVRYMNNGEVVKQNIIRLDRLVEQGETKAVYIDTKSPKKPFEKVEIFIFNENNGNKSMKVDNLSVESYNEK